MFAYGSRTSLIVSWLSHLLLFTLATLKICIPLSPRSLFIKAPACNNIKNMHPIHFHTKHHQFQRFNVQLELYMKKEKTKNKKQKSSLSTGPKRPPTNQNTSIHWYRSSYHKYARTNKWMTITYKHRNITGPIFRQTKVRTVTKLQRVPDISPTYQINTGIKNAKHNTSAC